MNLVNAFFSIAIAPDSQDQYAFTWEGRQLDLPDVATRLSAEPNFVSRPGGPEPGHLGQAKLCVTVTLF